MEREKEVSSWEQPLPPTPWPKSSWGFGPGPGVATASLTGCDSGASHAQISSPSLGPPTPNSFWAGQSGKGVTPHLSPRSGPDLGQEETPVFQPGSDFRRRLCVGFSGRAATEPWGWGQGVRLPGETVTWTSHSGQGGQGGPGGLCNRANPALNPGSGPSGRRTLGNRLTLSGARAEDNRAASRGVGKSEGPGVGARHQGS